MKITKDDNPERYNVENLSKEEFLMIYEMFNKNDQRIENDSRTSPVIRGWNNIKDEFTDLDEAKEKFKEFRDTLLERHPYA